MMELRSVLEIVTRTDPGVVRPNNEDSVMANAASGLVVLADGMGGYNAGEVASGMATSSLGTVLGKALTGPNRKVTDASGRTWLRTLLESEIAHANGAIYEAARSQPQYAGMGTTLVIGVFHDNRITVAHIGDSRLYRLRGKDFQQITRDHSLLQEQIDGGLLTREQARHSQNRNLVTRAVGIDPAVQPEIHEYAVLPGDIYLFCSDGLNDMVEDDEIAMVLGLLAANLGVCATQLIQMANDNGGRDNVSVALVKVRSEYQEPQGRWQRFLAWFK